MGNFSGVYVICMELSKTQELLTQLKHNISKLNKHVKGLILSPSKLDKASNDLPFNLLRAYKTVAAQDFKAAIERICDNSENSNILDKYMEV